MDADDLWDHDHIATMRAVDQALDEQDADDELWLMERDLARDELRAHNAEWQAFLDRLARI